MPSLKSTAQRALMYAHLYERAKASCLYDLFWRIADRRIIEARDCELQFYRNLLVGFHRGDLIFDIGANQGFKTDIFLRLGANVVAVDPDESNGAILAEKFLKYRFVKKPVSVVRKAVADKAGFETFWVEEPGSAKNTLNEKWVNILRIDTSRFGSTHGFKHRVTVETITLEDLINMFGLPFFVKIDVEGSESKVLGGLRRPVPYLSFEVNLPEFKDEGLMCLKMLERLAPQGLFNYSIESQPRLAAAKWEPARNLQQVLANSAQRSIEIFWTTVR